ncbi:MAG: GNAT family N-acetyltransferase [Spirochaetales bacterium]|nr:GNAT family N-acetyltransferase [Spirochaetales bacterium]
MRRPRGVIRKVDLCDKRVVRQLLRLQRLAYHREAELIGYRAIPALRDTAATLRASGESFHALLQGNRPLGVISWRRDGEVVEICRLVVHPRAWRRGVASRLLEHLEGICSAAALEVSTARANIPALQLYRRHGFGESSRRITPDGLELVGLRKPVGRGR